MTTRDEPLFSESTWRLPLEKFAALTHLTVVVYSRVGIGVGPVRPTPLFELFERRGYQTAIFTDCARQCLKQKVARPAIVVSPSYGLAVVGASLALEGKVVGAAVAGYAFIDFCSASAVERLAADAGVPFSEVWSIARVTAPIPEHRLALHGELLQVLGDTILGQNYQTRQYEETAAQLRAAIAAKDEFLAVVSHELRTPLTPILLWTRQLREGQDPARIARAVEVIERNARLEARLVEDLLEATRSTRQQIALDLAVHDLGVEVHAAVDALLEAAAERDIAVELVEADQPLRVRADQDRLQQIFRNVLSNALKFTPAGGRIAVTVRQEGGAAIVTIDDTGRGIAPEFQPFAFDMFRREHEGEAPEAGLGIGLALVKRLVELHGGAVTLSSAGVGRGTAVVIQLPLADAAEAAPPAREEPSGRPLSGVRALVVDDTDDVREAITALLEDLGAEVYAARDGVEALDLAKQYHPAVVLSDLHMPRMGGLELFRKLAESGNQGPAVIAMSGIDSESDARAADATGFSGHLRKPFAAPELLAAIETALTPGAPEP
ncbi:MAG: ATP-binding protein [Gemmatimonadales bacterium]